MEHNQQTLLPAHAHLPQFFKETAPNGQRIAELLEGSQLTGQVQRNDVVTAIDGIPTAGQTHTEITEYLRNTSHLERELTVARDEADAPSVPELTDLESEEVGAASSFVLGRMLSGFLTEAEGGSAEPNALAVRLRAHRLPSSWRTGGVVLSLRVEQVRRVFRLDALVPLKRYRPVHRIARAESLRCRSGRVAARRACAPARIRAGPPLLSKARAFV